jgi:hypothetical protein
MISPSYNICFLKTNKEKSISLQQVIYLLSKLKGHFIAKMFVDSEVRIIKG